MFLSLSSSNVRPCVLTSHDTEVSAYTYLKKKEYCISHIIRQYTVHFTDDQLTTLRLEALEDVITSLEHA
jgi:hypothetical protein